MKFSGQTACAKDARVRCNLMRWGNHGTVSAKPGVADQTSVTARKLKTRYATGGGARSVLFMHRILSNRTFGALMRLTDYMVRNFKGRGQAQAPSFLSSVQKYPTGGLGGVKPSSRVRRARAPQANNRSAAKG